MDRLGGQAGVVITKKMAEAGAAVLEDWSGKLDWESLAADVYRTMAQACFEQLPAEARGLGPISVPQS